MNETIICYLYRCNEGNFDAIILFVQSFHYAVEGFPVVEREVAVKFELLEVREIRICYERFSDEGGLC